MRRGKLSNTSAPEVWILAEVVYQQERASSKLLEVGTVRRTLERLPVVAKAIQGLLGPKYVVPSNVKLWLDSISFNVRPVLLWIGERHVPQSQLEEYFGKELHYKVFRDALRAVRVSPIAIEIVANSKAYLTDGVVLFDGNASRYGGKRWTLKDV